MSEVQDKPHSRDAQRRQTRERVFDAAIAEYTATGMAAADIAAIAQAAGVARGTFYFHFPTKEHVLFELEQREEDRIAQDLSRFLDSPHTLRAALDTAIALVLAMERRLGGLLFKDLLAVHFSPARPLGDEWQEHRVIGLVAQEFEAAAHRGEAQIAVDPQHSAVFFLLGLYALLTTTTGSDALRAQALDSYLTTTLRSLEPR